MKDLVDGYIARYGQAPSRAHVWALHEQAFRSDGEVARQRLIHYGTPSRQIA
jgi:hypothetical protein